jgi:hypothetical protein
MSTASQSASSGNLLKQAEELRRELATFAFEGPLKGEYERQQRLFFEMAEPADEHETESVRDWFLFEWFDDNGEGAIDHFLFSQSGLSPEQQAILLDWQDSIQSVFEIRSLGKNSVLLKDLDSGDEIEIITSTKVDRTPFKRGQYIVARLLPLKDQFIFSGLQFIMPDRATATAWLEMRKAFEEIESPEALEQAQREQCNAFCELFGCDELTVPTGELNDILIKFQTYLLTERRDPESGRTAAEVFSDEFGRELKVPEMPPLPAPVATAGEVTILCDDFDGIVLLPDYSSFRRIFECNSPDEEVTGWRDLLWKYIKDPDIPMVAFERVAEQLPERVEAAMRDVLEQRDFSIEHLYAAILHYKQPVEGLEDLEDEQQLWDLFNGNLAPNGNETSAGGTRKKDASKKTSSRKSGKKAVAAKTTKTTKARKTAKTGKSKAGSVKTRANAAKRATSTKGRKASAKPAATSKKQAGKASAKKGGARKGASGRKGAPGKRR